MKTFKTHDLNIATAIMSFNIPLVGRDKVNGKFLEFEFDNCERCVEIEKEWYMGTLEVNAVKYAESLKRLKNLIHSENYETN